MNHFPPRVLNQSLKKLLFICAGLLCLFPFVNSQLALLLGFVFSLVFGKVEFQWLSGLSKWLLQIAVVALGFCIDPGVAMNTGGQNFALVAISVVAVLSFGFVVARAIRLEKNLSILIASGTAICGGSAVASVAPVTTATHKDISTALAIIFLLNALAIVIFPGLGHAFEMTQQQFGLWCAIAIHDTSSVVGAAEVYGGEALMLATTTKLARVLWIIPLMLSLSIFRKGRQNLRFPWFVLLFIVALVLSSSYPLSEPLETTVFDFAKTAMSLVLFIIGTSLRLTSSSRFSSKPMLFGIALWVFIATLSAYVILEFY